MNFSMGPSNANDYWNDKLNLVLDLTWVHGSHTYKAGAQFGNEMWSDRNTRGAQGIYGFSNAQTGQPALQGNTLTGGSVGMNYASFLLGMTSSAQVNAVQDPQWRKNFWSLYVQDRERQVIAKTYGRVRSALGFAGCGPRDSLPQQHVRTRRAESVRAGPARSREI